MKDKSYIRAVITYEFLIKVLKKYTERLTYMEAQKVKIRKQRITKRIVCDAIIQDMEAKELI